METVVIQLARLVAAVVVAVVAQYLAIRVFDKLTTRIDEMEELRKGNAAVGVVLGAVIISVAIIVAQGVLAIVPGDMELVRYDFWGRVASGALNLTVSLVLAVGAQFLALSVFDKVAAGLDVQAELKKKNMGVAVLLAAVIIGIGLIVQAGIPRF
ncbi:MAG: DUF350 domain-containing protein [Candidatus Micrarchaeota archaeon]